MRMHISVAVDDVNKAIEFYSTLFGQEPVVVRDDYAKWMVENPRINFAIDKRCGSNGVDHLGIQAESQAELDAITERMQAAGQPYLDVGEVQCCYAKMDKAWTLGAGGEKWEGFLTHDQDAADYGEDSDFDRFLEDTCCPSSAGC